MSLKNPDLGLIRIHPECGFYGFMIRFWIRESGFAFSRKNAPQVMLNLRSENWVVCCAGYRSLLSYNRFLVITLEAITFVGGLVFFFTAHSIFYTDNYLKSIVKRKKEQRQQQPNRRNGNLFTSKSIEQELTSAWTLLPTLAQLLLMLVSAISFLQ